VASAQFVAVNAVVTLASAQVLLFQAHRTKLFKAIDPTEVQAV
jgi:hypothetical protein